VIRAYTVFLSHNIWLEEKIMMREKEWAVAFARQLASELPEAVRDVPELKLTNRQIAELRLAFENRLIQSMGEDADETPASIATRTANKG
jgi:hypothetical protein